ncbi:hypothetical protein ACMCNP_00150, partial [Candidatus Acidulodesulfobacterium sp. H_13]|uniref:hypothetical protein n=1 Tax=Candidatus Acidulodesulfobacterium sp. H_13 TaxID=3395470 RepID=UPI003AF9DA97
MKTVKFLQILFMGLIVSGIVFVGTSYGTPTKVTHKMMIKHNAKLKLMKLKLYIKILNKVGSNKEAAMKVAKKFNMNPMQFKSYMKKNIKLGDAVFIKMIKDNAVNKTKIKNFIKEYLKNDNAIYRLNGNETKVKNMIKEMSSAVKLKVVNEVYKAETGVTVDHTLSLTVDTVNGNSNLRLENHMAGTYMTHSMQSRMGQVNTTQRQINQVNTTQRQINQVNTTQRQINQVNTTQRQINQVNTTQRQINQV